MIQKTAAVGNWWLAASSRQRACSCITSRAEFLMKHLIIPVTQPPTTQIWSPATFGFSQNSNHLWKGRDLRLSMRFRKIQWGQLMVIGRTVWGAMVPTLKRTETLFSYIYCFLYLVFSSIYVSIFQFTWLDTFQTDLIFCYCLFCGFQHLKNQPTSTWRISQLSHTLQSGFIEKDFSQLYQYCFDASGNFASLYKLQN